MTIQEKIFYDDLGRVFDQVAKRRIKIMLEDFDISRGSGIFKAEIENDISDKIGNDNAIRIANFSKSSALFSREQCPIHQYVRSSPYRESRSRTDRILSDKRRYSTTVHVHHFRGSDCDTDHYLAVTKIRQ